MTLLRSTSVAAFCVVAGLHAAPAMADLTSAELWDNWREIAELQGSSLSAESVDTTPEGLVLTGVTVTVTDPDEGSQFTLRMDRLELGDAQGGVDMTIPTPQDIVINAVDPETEESNAVFALGGSGLEIRVEGTVAEPDYKFETDEAMLDLTELTAGGDPVPASVVFAMTGLSGALSGWSSTSDQLATGAVSIASLAFALEVEEVPTGGKLQTALLQEAIEATVEATPPGQDDGYSKLSVSTGPGEVSSMQTGTEQGDVSSVVRQESARYNLNVEGGRADYGAKIGATEIVVANERLPGGPAQFFVADMDMNFSLPLETMEDPQKMSAVLMLNDITFPEELWAQADPSLAIPRRPARVAVDVEADVLVTDSPPPSLEALADGGVNFLPLGVNLRGFAFEFAEAKVEAAGDFVFEAGSPNSPVPGALNPVGQLDVNVSGGLTLLQQLVAAGLVPQEQAMGAQMMLGMFATPGDGDTLTSTIVSEPGGGLVVNGTRLR